MIFIVALGLWPPFQYRGQYEGQHFLFDPAYNSARIDLVRLGIGWVAIALVVVIILLLSRAFSIRAIKIFGITLAVILVIAAGVVVVVRGVRENTRRQVNAALAQQARMTWRRSELPVHPKGTSFSPIPPNGSYELR